VLNYIIKISIDDEFGTDRSPYSGALIPVKGIQSIAGYSAIVDPSIFNGKDFFMPVLAVLNHNKRFKDITKDELYELMSKFGNFQFTLRGQSQEFNLDNPCDIWCVSKLDDIRIDISYKYSPISSVLMIDNGGCIEIHISPYTKNYFTMSESEWCTFVNYLERRFDLSEVRDDKIEEILGDVKPYKNLLRQLEFIVNNDRYICNNFFESVLRFYKDKGFISQKQASALMKSMWS
jgi:hypothetical protein